MRLSMVDVKKPAGIPVIRSTTAAMRKAPIVATRIFEAIMSVFQVGKSAPPGSRRGAQLHSAAGECKTVFGFRFPARSGGEARSLPAAFDVISRLVKRQIIAPTSSISMNMAGTNTSDRMVEKIRPPITAIAIGEDRK